MVEAFTTKPPQTPTETKSKRRKVEVEDSAVPLLTVASLSSSAIVANFQMAVACWDLLHSVTNLEKEFTKLCQHMRLDLCLKYFLLDITLYKEVFDEALFILQSLKTSPTEELRKNLQLASIYYRKGEKARWDPLSPFRSGGGRIAGGAARITGGGQGDFLRDQARSAT
ncbi:unnamed protein product, partial [Timema podura]|nr:unnamed protein product [Timema podura]